MHTKNLCTIVSVCVAVSVLLAVCGCKSEPKLLDVKPYDADMKLPEPSGGYTLSVFDQTLTTDDVIRPIEDNMRNVSPDVSYEQFRQMARPVVDRMVSNQISNVILYQYAKKELPENAEDAIQKAVDSEVRRFLLDFNNDYAKAEESLAKMGMDWEDLREHQKKLLISQSYMSSKFTDKPVSYSELVKEYEKMKAEAQDVEPVIQFQLIDIQPEKLNIEDPNDDRRKIAMEIGQELKQQLDEGADFGKLAEKYSHGHRKVFGGLWKPVQLDSLVAPYDKLAEMLMRLEEGSIAGPVRTDEHVFIAKVVKKETGEVPPLSEVQKQIEARIKLERRKQALDEISDEIVQQATLSNKERFIDFCTQRLYARAVARQDQD